MLKNLLIFIFALLLTSNLMAQNFSDDFESYEVGQYVGANSDTWTTWSGSTGGAEDAMVVNTQAKSGTKSIYFYSTAAGGGPQDVILPFGTKQTDGLFNLSYSIYVSEGSEAYMNIQGETTVGVTWVNNWFFYSDGTVKIDAEGETTTSYNVGEWNDISFDLDLENEIWVISINGTCVGTLTSTMGVASLDIYPNAQLSGVSEFWIDDISYTYNEDAPSYTNEVVVTGLNNGAGITSQPRTISGSILNKGTTVINDIKIDVNANGSQQFDFVDSGIDLKPGESHAFEIADQLAVINGKNVVDINISEINGIASDDNDCTNSAIVAFTGFTPTPNKRVLVEELTGTWCVWCPRGHVFMERMEAAYGDYFSGVAVHGGNASEPMLTENYANFMADNYSGLGYPSAIVDRTTDLDPGELEVSIVEQLQKEISATFDITATHDEATNEVVVYVKANALKPLPPTYKIWLTVKEDHVIGDDGTYNQANAYAGGTNGVMGGYELLPNPVPYTSMVYEQVARFLLPDEEGMKLPELISEGETGKYIFGFDMDPSWNLENLSLVAYITTNFNRVDNAGEVTFEEALSNYVSNENVEAVKGFRVYPNPSAGITSIDIELGGKSSLIVDVYSTTGQLVATRDYGQLSGRQIIPMNNLDLQTGVYNVVVRTNNEVLNKKLVIQK